MEPMVVVAALLVPSLLCVVFRDQIRGVIESAHHLNNDLIPEAISNIKSIAKKISNRFRISRLERSSRKRFGRETTRKISIILH